MRFNKISLVPAAGFALLAGSTGASHAWNTTVGFESTPQCVKTYTSGTTTLFTLDTDLYTTAQGSQTLYTYRLDLTNNGDTNPLTKVTVSAAGIQDYFIGFGPDNTGTAYHDSNIGTVPSTTAVSTGQNTTNPLTQWSATSTNSGITTVTFYANTASKGISEGKDLQGEGLSGSTVQSEYLYVQSLTNLGSLNVTAYDAKGSYGVATCNIGSKGTQGTPEPATLLPFAFGGLGLFGLALRARRSRAAA